MSQPYRVLFVCMGNICRSPAGEGLFRHTVEDHGAEGHVEIDSAGTIAYHQGDPPDGRMRQAAASRGYELEGSARQVRDDDFDRFDLIIAMDQENQSDLQAKERARDGQLRLLSSFLPSGNPVDVPDPYYGGADGFEQVLDMIEQACPHILDHALTHD